MEIKIEYDGVHPNLCRGKLSAIIDSVRYDFPKNCLFSGSTIDDDWSVEWPKCFPEELKEATLVAINKQIDHGCCGGCI